ncbi:hypothetical protein L9G15_10975 [Shewanella sp. A3A]|nr:hypothetical protein [Shewanella ferrihydritica]
MANMLFNKIFCGIHSGLLVANDFTAHHLFCLNPALSAVKTINKGQQSLQPRIKRALGGRLRIDNAGSLAQSPSLPTAAFSGQIY